DAGFGCDFVPVLEVQISNSAELSQTLDEPDDVAALVITSKNAVSSLLKVWKSKAEQNEGGGSGDNLWRKMPTYVVGKATAEPLIKEGFNVLGADSGAAMNLAAVIIHDIHALLAVNPSSGRILFLCGDKRLGTLPKLMDEAGIAMHELMVYRTIQSVDFDRDLDIALGHGQNPVWITFFSPSGVDCSLRSFQKRSWWGNANVACIGPTTASYLQSHNVEVKAIAKEPTPNSLLKAIVEANAITYNKSS
ncbi:tetrapyrrole biosynthesis, uroporphyrinogen III synthase, partial [Chytridium lagenaria]